MVNENLKRIMISLDADCLSTLERFCERKKCSTSVALSLCLEYTYYVHYCCFDNPLPFDKFVDLFFKDIHGHHFVRIIYDDFGNRKN